MTASHTTLTELGKQFTEKIVQDDTTSYCWLEANTSSRKTVVLIHGVTGNKLDMAVLGVEYVKRGYAVFAPDLPGHGKAPVLDARSFDDLSIWLDKCIQAIGRVPDILVGNSFASAICYTYALRGHLNTATHLILSCPTPDIAWSSRALQWASGVLPSGFASKAYNSRPGIGLRVNYLHKVKKRPSAKEWLRESEYHKIPFIDARASNRLANLFNVFNPYDAPMLPLSVQERITVVVGTKDNVITRKSLPKLRRILPKARLLIIPNVGHILHFEAPYEIVDALR